MSHLEYLALMQARDLPRDVPTAGDWANILAQFPLFTRVSRRRLRKLARSAKSVEFAPGETIVIAGDREDWLYVILAGHAKTTSRGDRRLLRAGEYFGELALIDGLHRSATVVAVDSVQVMKLPSRSVVELARRHPAITLTMLRDLSKRIRRLEAERARVAAAG